MGQKATTMTATTPQFTSLRQKIAWETAQRKARQAQYATDWRDACDAGDAAVAALTVVPMTVVGKDTTYFVEAGVCGFAQVQVKPRNSGFAKWLLAQGIGRSSDYYKCVYYNVHQFNQSLQRKEAWAMAVAAFLTAKGYTGVSWESRID